MKRKRYTQQEKAKVVLELLREEKTAAQIASEYGIHPAMLSQWKKTVLEGLPGLFVREERKLKQAQKEHQEEKDQLYQKIGHLEVQLDWLKKKSEELQLKRRAPRDD